MCSGHIHVVVLVVVVAANRDEQIDIAVGSTLWPKKEPTDYSHVKIHNKYHFKRNNYCILITIRLVGELILITTEESNMHGRLYLYMNQSITMMS